MMHHAKLSISALPAWMKLNAVIFYNINVHDMDSKGLGLAADKDMSSEDATDTPMLMRVPKDLILSVEVVEEHAKVDKDFRELLSAIGGLSTRGDILLFLLMQLTIASATSVSSGVSSPWSEYVRMLPSNVPVPTTWSEEERMLLAGTSLELPLTAKMSALLREFERLRDLTGRIPWCQKAWWESRNLALSDWILLDSWYRSRCLELPECGECMVPCLDIVNHAEDANAYYEQTRAGDAVLLLRPKARLDLGEEITISYGSSKSPAEMLFNYGFVDEGMGADSLMLDLHPLPDDPLGRAKQAAFSGRPTVSISSEAGAIEWSSAFLYFMCVNEEDGLEFRVLQETDGSQSGLQVFWQDRDITDTTADFEHHIAQHPLKDVFSLRAVCIMENRLQEQLERLYASEYMPAVMDTSLSTTASKLRHRESTLLEKAYSTLDVSKTSLMESPVVVAYLTSMQPATSDSEKNATIDEDFS